jgi:hypothetical protein
MPYRLQQMREQTNRIEQIERQLKELSLRSAKAVEETGRSSFITRPHCEANVFVATD